MASLSASSPSARPFMIDLSEMLENLPRFRGNEEPKGKAPTEPITLTPAPRYTEVAKPSNDNDNILAKVLDDLGNKEEELKELRAIMREVRDTAKYLDERLDIANRRIKTLEEENEKLQITVSEHGTLLDKFRANFNAFVDDAGKRFDTLTDAVKAMRDFVAKRQWL